MLVLLSAANEPVLVAKFIYLAAIPQMIGGHKKQTLGGGNRGMNLFDSFIFIQK